MSTPRPGSYASIAFLAKSNDCEFNNEKEWSSILKLYPQCLKAEALKKKKPWLVELDQRLHSLKFRNIVMTRDEPHLTLSELSDIMKWKLSKGRMRPLQNVCDNNNPDFVIKSTKAAFQELLSLPTSTSASTSTSTSKKLKQEQQQLLTSINKAMNHLKQLQSIGDATASMILSLFSMKPFYHIAGMADEALDTINGRRNYTYPDFLLLTEECQRIATCLNSKKGTVGVGYGDGVGDGDSRGDGDGVEVKKKKKTGEHDVEEEVMWTAADVSKALWTTAKCAEHAVSIPDVVKSKVNCDVGVVNAVKGKVKVKIKEEIKEEIKEKAETGCATATKALSTMGSRVRVRDRVRDRKTAKQENKKNEQEQEQELRQEQEQEQEQGRLKRTRHVKVSN